MICTAWNVSRRKFRAILQPRTLEKGPGAWASHNKGGGSFAEALCQRLAMAGMADH